MFHNYIFNIHDMYLHQSNFFLKFYSHYLVSKKTACHLPLQSGGRLSAVHKYMKWLFVFTASSKNKQRCCSIILNNSIKAYPNTGLDILSYTV